MGAQSLLAGKEQAYSGSNDQRMWSKKLDKNKDKAVRLTKNLGSTSNYIGDVVEKYVITEEKITIINDEEERLQKAAKDKASVKYNF